MTLEINNNKKKKKLINMISNRMFQAEAEPKCRSVQSGTSILGQINLELRKQG